MAIPQSVPMGASNNQQMHKIRKKVQYRPTVLGRASTHPRDLMLACLQAHGGQPPPNKLLPQRKCVKSFFETNFSIDQCHLVYCTSHTTESEIKLVPGLFWFLCFKAENIFVNREDINTKKCFKNLFNC